MRSQLLSRLTLLSLLFISVLLIGGCGMMAQQQSSEKLAKSIKTYTEAMRWSEWHILMSYYKPTPGEAEAKEASSDNLDYLDNVKVTSIEETEMSQNIEQTEANTLLLIEYYLVTTNKVRKIKHRMTWWYDKDYEAWYTSTPLPDFK